MKKNLVILSILLCFVFAGCSNKTVENKTTEKPAEKAVETNYTLHGIPVLMYHSIGVEKGNPIRMPKEQFEKEMKYIKDNGYTTITLKELYDYFDNKKNVPDKAIVITLDDGYEDNYTEAYPILKKYNLKATIFMVTSTVDVNKKCLTSDQLKEMDKNGIDIESHTVTHRDLDTLSYLEQLKELKDSKAYLENLLGKEVDYLAYPTGKYNNDTIKAAKEAGYKMALTTNGRWSDKSDGIYTLDRVYISTFFSMDIFAERLTNPNYKVY
ncbi:MAG: polysaccharide deacetylase family protein [Solirubrobacterales bacterium]